MQNITGNQFQHLYEGGSVGVSIEVDFLVGNNITINQDHILEGTLTINRNWVSGNNLEIGNAETSELVFELDNSDGQWSNVRWEGARLTVTWDIDGEPLHAGVFTVDEQPRKLSSMQIRALDAMARFNRAYDSPLPYPATLLQVVQDACNRCNVTLYTQSFTNSSYLVLRRPEGDDITYHHIVSWVAELAGSNAWIDHLDRLQLSWYGDNQTQELEIGPEDRFQYDIAEDDLEITGIVYRPATDEDEIDYVVGTDKYALVIEDNLLLQENYEIVLSNIYSKLGGFKYRPYSFEVLGYPHLWPGDVIDTLIDAEGNEISSLISNHTYKLNGNSSIKAKGETETVKGYATGAPFTRSQKRVLQSVAYVEAERQASAVEQTTLQLNQLMANSLGYYETIEQQETGASIKYIHDLPILETSTNIWKYSAEGYAWTDQGWQDGSPVWQYGVTADGSMVAKILAVTGIYAEWIQVGSAGQYIAGEIDTAEQSAKDFATSEAEAAFTSAQLLLNSLADGTYHGGSFIDGNTIYAPNIVGLNVLGLTGEFNELWAGNRQAAHLELGQIDNSPSLKMYDTNGVARIIMNQSVLEFVNPDGTTAANMTADNNRMNIYTRADSVTSKSWIELWDTSDLPGRQGELIMGANHFVWRIDGSNTGSGTEAMRLDNNGNLTVGGNLRVDGSITHASIPAARITSGTLAVARIPTITHGMTNFANQALNTGSNPSFGTLNVNHVIASGNIRSNRFAVGSYFDDYAASIMNFSTNNALYIRKDNSNFDTAIMVVNRSRNSGGFAFRVSNSSNWTSTSIDWAGNFSTFGNGIFYGDLRVDGSITHASIPAARVNSGTLAAARLPNHSAALLTSGTLAAARLPATITGNKTFTGGIRMSNYPVLSGSANMHMNSLGDIHRTSSSIRYKQDVETYADKGILKARPVTFRDKKAAAEQGDEAPTYLGLIAEEVDELGLTELVDYDGDIPEGVNYDRIAVALLSVVKEQECRINKLEQKLEEAV